MITDIKQAVTKLCSILHELPTKIEDLNEGRYKLIVIKNETCLLKYTRQHFLTFKDNAHGESLNVDDLNIAIEKGIKRVFIVYTDGKIYTISPKTILTQAEVRKTEAEGKDTYSFNMNLLINMKTNKQEETK